MLGTQQGVQSRLGLGFDLHEALQALVEFLRGDLDVLTQSGGGFILSLRDGFGLGG